MPTNCNRRLIAATTPHLLVVTLTMLAPAIAEAQVLQVMVENLNPVDGFYVAPMFIGFHDGSYDLFNPGTAATPGLEQLAENGPSDVLATEFAGPGRVSGTVLGLQGFGSMAGQPPIIDGGETASTYVTIGDPTVSRYVTFAAMVVPSNDAFIGNGDPFAYEVFDAAGNFLGPLTIDVFGSSLWDAGTEVNDRMGAAFSTLGGTSSDEGGTVHLHPGLENFEGSPTPVGSIGAGLAPGPDELIARITITQVPEPASVALVGLAILGTIGWRHRRMARQV